jgi:hypothetical protein
VAIAELYSGSETVSTTEHSLTTDTAGPDVDTTDAVMQVWLDLNALVKGDIFELKIYEKVTSGGTQRVVYSVRFANAQTEPIWVSPTLIVMHGWDVTLDKISGTDAAITWSIRTV